MGSMLGDWPSHDPYNFSQLRPSDPSNPSRLTPATYHPTHSRTLPPPDQEAYTDLLETLLAVICTESKNILIRHFYKHAEEKLRSKRAASEHLAPENGAKHLRASSSGTPI